MTAIPLNIYFPDNLMNEKNYDKLYEFKTSCGLLYDELIEKKPQLRNAVFRYSFDLYRYINSYLRGNKYIYTDDNKLLKLTTSDERLAQKYVTNLDRAISLGSCAFNFDITCFRVIKRHATLEKRDQNNNIYYETKYEKDDREQLSVDDSINDKAFRSFSLDVNHSLKFCDGDDFNDCILIQLRIPAYTNIFFFDNRRENEIILDRTFQIRKLNKFTISFGNGKTRLEVVNTILDESATRSNLDLDEDDLLENTRINLITATLFNNLDRIQFYLKTASKDMLETIFKISVVVNNISIVQYLLQKGVRIDSFTDIIFDALSSDYDANYNFNTKSIYEKNKIYIPDLDFLVIRQKTSLYSMISILLQHGAQVTQKDVELITKLRSLNMTRYSNVYMLLVK